MTDSPSVEDVEAFLLKQHSVTLSPWQRKFVQAAFNGEQILVHPRRAGRTYLAEQLDAFTNALGNEQVQP